MRGLVGFLSHLKLRNCSMKGLSPRLEIGRFPATPLR